MTLQVLIVIEVDLLWVKEQALEYKKVLVKREMLNPQ